MRLTNSSKQYQVEKYNSVQFCYLFTVFCPPHHCTPSLTVRQSNHSIQNKIITSLWCQDGLSILALDCDCQGWEVISLYIHLMFLEIIMLPVTSASPSTWTRLRQVTCHTAPQRETIHPLLQLWLKPARRLLSVFTHWSVCFLVTPYTCHRITSF